MSQKPNHRRGEKRHQDNGPTWEGGPPNSGTNSTHVARARKKWKRRANRSLRRTGTVTPKFISMAGSSARRPKPRPE
jgi:hypothetical protein